MLLLTKRFLPQMPSVLVSMTAAGLAVAILHLDTFGVAILGRVPQGLPSLRLPSFPAEDLPKLIAEAAGLALVLFSSGMLTGRSFAEKHDYEFDADHEFAALGAANIASALSQGFSVTGADSRTAVADSAGGRTQVTGLIAAASIAMVLLFLTKPLQFVPVPALGAALVFASFSLFDVNTLRHIWSVDKTAVGLSVITTLGVVAFGAIQAILLAVILSLAVFVKLVARPKDEVLGKVKGMPGWHCIERHPGAQTISGLVIYRFNSPITFFNSAYFKQRARLMVQSAGPGLEFFVLDAIPIVTIDVTGLYALGDFKAELNRQGITLLVAGRRTELLNWFRETGLYRPEFDESFFVTLQQAIEACRPEILHQPFLHARFGLGDDVLKPYKETLDRWLWPDVLRNQHTSVVKAKQAISSYRKAVGAPVGLAELMVFYCEHAAQFCSYIGYQDESYFDALVGMFEQALEVSAQLPASERKALITRLDKVRVISRNFGYGVGDDMDCVLAKYVRK